MEGICSLTGEYGTLRCSHIYPKFVIEWMKQTGSKYLRSCERPNQRSQDGEKAYLLSEKAEQLFSLREKWFAEHIFRPYLENSSAILSYDENLFHFALSMLWRILVLELKDPETDNLKFKNTMVEAEQQWRDFLHKSIYPKDFDSIHLILFDRIESHILPMKGVEYYLTRALDRAYHATQNKCAVYVKFSRFAFWGLLSGLEDMDSCDTKINPIQGEIAPKDLFLNSFICDFYQSRVEIIDTYPNASEKQQKIIKKEILDHIEDYKGKELIDIMEADYLKPII